MATDAQGRELSPDGNYYWDGSDWQLVDQSAASGGDSSPASGGDGGFSSGGDGPMSSQSTATDAQGRQLSPDGNYYWDGSDWQPVSASGSAGSAAGGDPSSASAGAGTTQTPDSPGSSGGDDGSSSGGYSGSSAGGDGSASSQSGQLSPDGNYYWDGANWQPVSASVGSSAGGDPSSASPGAFGSGDQSLNARDFRQ